MTATTADPASPAVRQGPRTRTRSRGRRLGLVVLALSGVMLVLSIASAAGDAPDLTSSGTFAGALRQAVPIGLVAVGAIYSERAGIVNIGLEGMLILGTWFGAFAGFTYGPWWGVLAGMLGGALGGLLHAVATVSFGVDHIISGVAINILGAGIARYLSVIHFSDEGGGATQSPRIQSELGSFDVPVLAGGEVLGWNSPDVLGDLEGRDVFFVSDVAGFLGGLTRAVPYLTLVAVALVPISAYVLFRTAWGLRLRSCGEHPAAAETLGVGVYRMRYYGVVISGAFAGLGGAFIVVELSRIYREGQTGGRGFIGLAAMIFGNWMPWGGAGGAGLFGYANVLRLRDERSVHALLLAIGLTGLLVGAWLLWRGRPRAGVVVGLIGLAIVVVWALTDSVPSQFVDFTAPVVTLLVLSLSAQRLRPPASVGEPYRRGEAS